MEYRAFLYDLYGDNHAIPVDGYVKESVQRFSMAMSRSTVERWFLTIRLFKGVMRVISRYPSG